jgi:DNA-binding transcriptional ArsR family regulator
MMNIAAEQLEPIAREATRLLKALAHPSRLLICCQLRDGEMSVGRIETTLGIRQPNLSRELARLRDDRIVTTRRESRVVFYRLDDDRARCMIDALCEVMLGGNPATAGSATADRAAPRTHGTASALPASEDALIDATSGGESVTNSLTDDVFSQARGYGVFACTGSAATGEE